MKVRELLQIELWSKSTSWKICLGLVGFVVLGLPGVYAVERFWISPAERSESQRALAKAELLEKSDSLGDKEFGEKAQQAEQEIEVATGKARTYRDVDVTFQLSRYLHFLLLERIQAHKENGPGLSQTWRDKMHSSEAQLRQELHHELD
jgi:hypothetical protein